MLHTSSAFSISPVVTSVARGNIHHYRILVTVNCVTINLHSSVTRIPFSGELIVASVSGSISQTQDLTLTPKSPSGSVIRISYRVLFWHSGARFPKQGVSSSHLKSHFTPTKHLIWLALNFPSVSVQSTVSRFHSLI